MTSLTYTQAQLDILLSGKATPAQITAAVAALTKASVGLGNVDNTSDVNKPVSTATATAISTAVNGLVNGAPGALDQLNELATALGNDANFAATITNALALKANLSALATVATTGSYADLANKPTIPAAYTDEQARDALAAALVPGGGISIVPNDGADTITIAAVPSSTARTGDFTFALGDAGALQDVTAATNLYVTIPTAAQVAYAVNTELEILNRGPGTVTILPAASNVCGYSNGDDGTTTGWAIRSSTIAANGSNGVAGSGSIRATSTGTGSFGAFGDVITLASVGLAPGDVISSRVWFKLGTNATNALFGIRAQYGTASIGNDVQATAVTSTTGAYASIAGYVIPPGTESIRLITYATAAAAGAILDFDEPQISVGPSVPSAYVATTVPTILARNRTLAPYTRSKFRLTASGWIVTTSGIPSDVLLDSDTLANDRDNKQTGIIAPSAVGQSATTLVTTTNRGYYARFVPSRLMIVSSLSFRVSTGAASDVGVVAGIYSSSLAKLTSSNATTGLGINTVGTKNVPFTPLLLQPGTVYYALLAIAGTPTLAATTYPTDLFGAATPAVEMFYVTDGYTSGGPSPAVPAANTDIAPLLAIRES